MDVEEPGTTGATQQPGDVLPLAEMEPFAVPRRRRPWLRTLGVVVPAVLVAAAVGLTGTTRFPSPKLVLSQAAALTTGAGSATGTGSVDVSVGGRSLRLMDMTMSADFATKSAAVEATIGSVHESSRRIGSVSYLSIPIVALPHGAHWLSMTDADLNAAGAGGIQGALGSTDPASGLGYLNALRGDPRVLGRETLDGVDVTHYAFVLDLKDFYASLSTTERNLGVGGALGDLGSLGNLVDLSAIPGEAWIDAAGRVRRFEFTLEMTEAGQTVRAHADVRFTDFGVPVHIEAPAPSDTVTFAQDPGYFRRLGEAAAQAAAGVAG